MTYSLTMSKMRRHLVFAALALSSATAVAACASSEEEPEPTVQEVRQHQRGALHAVINASMEAADLTTDQKAEIETIRDRFRTDDETRHKLREEMRTTASEIVRDGTTQTERFDAAVERAATAIETRIEMSSQAVKDVHALLTPEQRVAVAEVLRERVDEKWGKVRRDRHEGFRQFATELALTPEQVAEIEKVRDRVLGQSKRLRPTAEELYDLIGAFETEDFAAALDDFHAEKAPLLREKLANAGDNADTVLGILEDEQRALLADIIEDGSGVLKPNAAARAETATP